jgi:hypothetical protein
MSAAETDEMEIPAEAMLSALGNLSRISKAAPGKAKRKTREKAISAAPDGRSLRSKGRTVQLNVKIRPDIKQAIDATVATEGSSLADWLEKTLEAALGIRGN